MGQAEKEIIGIILLNLGGPDSLRAVKPFLYNLFSDRKIIRLGPAIFQKPIAWLISSLRSRKTERIYSLIGGRSPILNITREQAAALETALNQQPVCNQSAVSGQSAIRGQSADNSEQPAVDSHQSSDNGLEPLPIPPSRGGRAREGVAGIKFKVYIGMRYWHPLIEEVVPAISRDGVKKLVALSMYPHYSLATAGSSMSRLMEIVEEYPIEVLSISSWHDHPLYIEALTDLIKRGLDAFTSDSDKMGTEGLKGRQTPERSSRALLRFPQKQSPEGCFPHPP